MLPEQIATIALDFRLKAGQTALFSYTIPPELQGIIVPGQLVWVPLRQKQVQGIVLTLSPPSPAQPKFRNILTLADPEAIILPVGLQLAQWLANTYRVALYEALKLFLPPGVEQESLPTWQTSASGLTINLANLPLAERAILYAIRTHGKVSEPDLLHLLRGNQKDLRETIFSLYQKGLLERGIALSAPKAQPKFERFVKLLLDSEKLLETIATLGRAPKQQALLQWFAEHKSVESYSAQQIYAATGANLPLLQALATKGILAFEMHEAWRDPLAGQVIVPATPPILTAAQRQVWEIISAALDKPSKTQAESVFLLHGVTGSGKTELYMRAIARVLRQGKQALVLIPEIALTAQFIQRFGARFPGKFTVLHSRLAPGERYDAWRKLRNGQIKLAIGSRSAVFAPLPHLGLIVMDEEHEPSYKQDNNPHYHARDVALQLGKLTQSCIILGSATPSIESYYAAKASQYTLLALPERIGCSKGPDGLLHSTSIPLPTVQLVDMRRELQRNNRSIFSQPLQEALKNVLDHQEQAILFLNRRGKATFVLCRDCGKVLSCPKCLQQLTFHELKKTKQNVLLCHSCSYHLLLPAFCPVCLSPRIKDFGIGTQRVEAEVRLLFPKARILRWDSDSAVGKNVHSRFLKTFQDHEADLLIGTQMIAKGLDLPLVSFVGVVAADSSLYFPDFRSGERTFQLLTQVAGRAGRRKAGARVIIQTYSPENYVLQAAQEHDYQRFYLQELAFRRLTGYPPFNRLIRFVYGHTNEALCKQTALDLATKLREIAVQNSIPHWQIIGPAPAFKQRLQGKWRWHCLLCLPNPLLILPHLGDLPGWHVDVDPLNVL